MKLTILGAGNALAVDLYNTCFALTEKNVTTGATETFLVDAGGGNGILRQLRQANIDYKSISTLFVTHPHTDHILGAIWVIRMIAQDMTWGKYQGNLQVYGNAAVISFLKHCYLKLIRAKEQPFLGTRIFLNTVKAGDSLEIFGRPLTFFDLHSTKAPQFGFTYYYDEYKKLTCCGDEPLTPINYQYAENSEWLFHEAFCLYAERDIFDPYEKQHSTVKDACQLAQQLKVQNLLLYHTEETHGAERQALYTAEARQYFQGNIFVPNDLEYFEL